MAEPLRLRTALSPLAHHQALRDGSVAIPGVSFEWVDVPRLPDIFARMGRGLEFDVCELSVMTFLLAREHELPISAIPVVPRHAFHHGDFQVHTGAGISEPSELEGRRVGTRSWTLTPGGLDRGILADEYGIDLNSITWVLAGEEHLRETEARLPANTVRSPGIDLFDAVANGEIDAGIAGVNVGRRRSASVTALFANAAELDRREYERTGIVPGFTIIAISTRASGKPATMASSPTRRCSRSSTQIPCRSVSTRTGAASRSSFASAAIRASSARPSTSTRCLRSPSDIRRRP
jgi:4,5-dihydroxyphthalate decarboxylase